MDSLKQVINNLISLSPLEMDFMLSFFKPVSLKKDEYFLEIGQKCNEVAFVKTGLLRIFYPNDKGEETTCYFPLPGEFVTSFSSFTAQTPSVESIQAILPSEIFVVTKQDLETLYQKLPASQELSRKTAENVAMIMEKRIALFLNNSADERYQFLLKYNPILIQTVPLHYLASYLGVTPQHLSRLRK